MQLFYAPVSPFARKCRVLVLEKKLESRVELVKVDPYQSPPELMAVNPLSTVPAFVTADGQHLCESPIICDYIDSLDPENALIPARDSHGYYVVMGLSALADGVTDAAIACVLDSRRPEVNRNPDWVVRKGAAIQRGISLFEKHLAAMPTPFNMGAISAACALGYIDFRLPSFNWKEAYPDLASWYGDIATRPSLLATAPAA